MEKYIEVLQGKLSGWLSNLIRLLPNMVLAAIVIILFFFCARLVRRLITNLLFKKASHTTIVSLLSNVIYVAIILIGIFIALDLLHLEKTISSLLAGAGIIGLALGFAFQDLTANFISGLFIILRKPFEIGHLVDTNGFTGIVEDIQLRSTTLRTTQGLHIMLPNKEIFQKALTNYSLSGRRRIDVVLTLPSTVHPEDVKKKIFDVLKSRPVIEDEKNIQIFLTDFNGDTVKLEVWCWIDNCKQDLLPETKDDLIKNIQDVLKNASK